PQRHGGRRGVCSCGAGILPAFMLLSADRRNAGETPAPRWLAKRGMGRLAHASCSQYCLCDLCVFGIFVLSCQPGRTARLLEVCGGSSASRAWFWWSVAWAGRIWLGWRAVLLRLRKAHEAVAGAGEGARAVTGVCRSGGTASISTSIVLPTWALAL